jgi:signal transduction histidine kinase
MPRRVAYLLATLPLGCLYFSLLVGGLVGAASSAFFFGLPLLAVLLLAWRRLARFHRKLLRRWLGEHVEEPYRPLTSPSAWGRMRERIGDPATWKDLAYLLLMFPMGILSAALTVSLAGIVLCLVSLPIWYWAPHDGVQVLFMQVDTLPEAIIAMLLAAPAALLFGVAAHGLARLHTALARALLTPSPDPVMLARVDALQDSRARIIAAADAERRRLERDLHDGAQQRLVALSMSLGLARRRMARGEDARSLVESADDELRSAIAELRDLARGIHPAVLTDRGLAAALHDLANRAPIPVELAEPPAERLPDAVEAAAYFTVSEALTNIAKHAQAESATVEVREQGEVLVIEVADDGVGGAGDGDGSGLRGLTDRLAALGGELSVVSPPGGGTRLTARIPVPAAVAAAAAADRLTSGVEAPAEGLPVPVPSRRREGRARQVLNSHGVVFVIVMLLLVFIWATTGGGYFWPQWPFAGWGCALALHAWFAVGRHRGMLAATTQRQDAS